MNRSTNKHHSESIPKTELMLVQRPQKTPKKKRNRNCVNDSRILGNIVDAHTLTRWEANPPKNGQNKLWHRIVLAAKILKILISSLGSLSSSHHIFFSFSPGIWSGTTRNENTRAPHDQTFHNFIGILGTEKNRKGLWSRTVVTVFASSVAVAGVSCACVPMSCVLTSQDNNWRSIFIIFYKIFNFFVVATGSVPRHSKHASYFWWNASLMDVLWLSEDAFKCSSSEFQVLKRLTCRKHQIGCRSMNAECSEKSSNHSNFI